MKRTFDDAISPDFSQTFQLARHHGIITPSSNARNLLIKKNSNGHSVESRSFAITISNTNATPNDVIQHIITNTNLAHQLDSIEHIVATRESHADGQSYHVHVYIHSQKKLYINSNSFKQFSDFTHVTNATVHWLHYIMKTFERKVSPFGYFKHNEINPDDFSVYGKIGRERATYENTVRYSNDSLAHGRYMKF